MASKTKDTKRTTLSLYNSPLSVIGEPKLTFYIGFRQAFDESDNIESHASIVTQILVPVCITMAIVITLVKLLNPPESLGGYVASSNLLIFARNFAIFQI